MTNPIELLRGRLVGQSLRSAAKELGISAAYLSDILADKRPIGPKVLAALGLEKQVTYRKTDGRRTATKRGAENGR